MTAPQVRVEIGYGSTWKTEPGDIVWTDETARVLVGEGVGCRRGASSARGKPDVGTLSFSLKNQDRRFDPTYAPGDLFGDLLPGTPVRVVAEVDGGSDVALWSGTVPAWPQRYDRGNTMATVPITAYDRFDKLSRAKIPRSVMASVIMPLEPVGYWPLDDPKDSGYVTDVTGRNMGTVWDEPLFEQEPLGPGLGPSVYFDGVNDRIDITRGVVLEDPSYSALMAVIRTSSPSDVLSIHPVFFQGTGNVPNTTSLFLYIKTDGTIAVKWSTETLLSVRNHPTVVSDGEPHLVIAQSDFTVPADRGIAIDSATLDHTSASPVSESGSGVAIGGTPLAGKGYDDNYYEGRISHVAIWDRPLTLTERQAIVDAYASLDGQTSDERITWILDEIGWPANLRNLEVGRSLLGPATLKPGDGALQYLRLIEETEDGRLFIGPDGSLTFHDRYFPYLQTVATVSQFTFTDQDGDQGYADFQLDVDDELLVNVARFSRRDGAEQVVVDQPSVDTYGEAEEQRSNLLSTTDAQVRSLAEWTVATRSTALPRVPVIRIPLLRYSAADQETVLGLDLGHRVTVNRTPQGVGAAIDLDFIVDGISHEVGVNEWWVDLYVSPVPQDAADLFLLGSSELGGTHILAH